MNITKKISIRLLSLLMLTLFFLPTFAHAATPDPSSYFSDAAVSEVGELWNKNCEVLHFIYYNDGRGMTWHVVGTCAYYPYSPEHTVYDISHYPDGSQSVRVDHRDTGAVDATPPSQEAFEQAQATVEAELGHPIENVHQLDQAYQALYNQTITSPTSTAESSSEPTPEPTPNSTPQATAEPTTQAPTYALIIEYDVTHGTVEGAGVYEENSKVNLVVQPNEGFTIDYWTGIDDDTYVLMTEDKVIEVFFKAIESPQVINPSDKTMANPTTELTLPIASENVLIEPNQSPQETKELTTAHIAMILSSVVVISGSGLFLLYTNKKKKQK
jgi:hypothetical protein